MLLWWQRECEVGGEGVVKRWQRRAQWVTSNREIPALVQDRRDQITHVDKVNRHQHRTLSPVDPSLTT